MIRPVVHIDATVTSDAHWDSGRLVLAQVDEVNRTAPKGALVRLFVGGTHAPWPAGAYVGQRRVDPIWATFVERFNIEITGTVPAIREWTESLNQCVGDYPTAAGI